MPVQTDQSLLLAHAAARARGDAGAATKAWADLAVNNFDRVRTIVRVFRFPGGQPIPHDDHDDAASEAFIRLIAMGTRFQERHVGAYYAALSTCVQHACQDFGRKQLRHDKRAAGSFDDTFEPGGEAGPYDAALAQYGEQLREQTRDAVEAERERLEAEQLVAWAIAQVGNENYRAVLQLTLGAEPLSGDEIAARLGITPDNVYQRRRRGTKELERILRGL